MLKLVPGRINSGKTTYIQQIIKELAEKGSKVYIIVPDQFSFESEKQIIALLGEKRAMQVEVSGFTRLAQNIIGNVRVSRRLDEAGKVALMSLALEETQDKLSVYGRFAKSTGVVSEMLKVYDELKYCAIKPQELEATAQKLPDGMLRKKLIDLSLVSSAFEALTAQRFSDDRDMLSVLTEHLYDNRFFGGATVFIDGFKGFTAQELDLISAIMAQSENTYITLCTDKIYGSEHDISPFACVRSTAQKLIDAANKNGVAVKQEFPPAFENRYASKAIEALENGLYAAAAPFEGDSKEVCICSARNIYEECDYVARNVKRLLREENYRCREIAIISRSEQTYSKALRAALKKYGVDVFEDKRRPLAVYPPVVLVRAVAEIAAKGYSSDAIFRALKTQLAVLNIEQISELEEYVYLWQIDGKKWLSEWTFNPSGLGSAPTKDDEAALVRLNELRKICIEPLEKLIKAVKFAENSRELVTAFYNYLIQVKTPESLKALAVELNKSGETDEAVELGRVWDRLMEIFDQLAIALDGSKISASRFFELFQLVLSVQDMGVIPGGIDEIIIGSAERIRINRPRAVFAVGVNDGVFPQKPSAGKVLGDADRQILTNMGLRITEPSKYAFLEERHFAYNALCCANERLWLTFCSTDSSGSQAAPSELIAQVRNILPKCEIVDVNDSSQNDILYLVESEASAFELAAKHWHNDSVEQNTLKACLKERAGFDARMQALDRAGKGDSVKIEDKQVAVELFGYDIHVSATRIEDFGKCPFLFFCRHGLKLNERKKAEIDSALGGTVVHYVLENLVSRHRKALTELSSDEIKSEVISLLDDFLAESMGGAQEKDERFVYLYNRLCDSLLVVAQRLINEMRLSDFEPADFELQIGGFEPQIPGLVVNLPDGGKIVLNGKVDRVDVLKAGDETFVRVMDYKTGTKKFNLNDVLHGLNMQMLLYLFAIKANGKERYGNIVPAGILYVPAKNKGGKISHSTAPEEIEKTVIAEGRMSGLVLDDDRVIHSTDRECTGTVIAGKNDMRDSLISLTQLANLEKQVIDCVKRMGVKLHEGDITAKPVYGGSYTKAPCEYCAYSDVCLHEETGDENKYGSRKHSDCLTILETEGEENA